MMHYAQLENSDRLKRLLRFLSDGLPHTTREIFVGAEVCAVSTAVDELRENGFEIECKAVGRGRYEYQLKSNEQRAMSNEARFLPNARNDKGEGAHDDTELFDRLRMTEGEDKSKEIIESIMERNFQLSLKV